MKDTDCVDFLQWALPRLNLRWPGFRRVRAQVCKRIDRRIHVLGLSGCAGYAAYLTDHSSEWAILDALCVISISRFYRDRAVYDCLGETVLPQLVNHAGARQIRCWTAGCASGEEPYTLSLIWDLRVRPRFPLASLAIVATDVDEHLLKRARVGCYPKSALRELPPEWIEHAFGRIDDCYCLRDRWRTCVEFRWQDLRVEQPSGDFDLVLCRNLAFTYFNEQLQTATLAILAERLRAEGVFVIGRHESLPPGGPFQPFARGPGIYVKVGPARERQVSPW